MFGFELINLAGSSKPSSRNVAILARMVSGLTRVQVMISRENVVNNGHPADKYGWAVAGGAKFNIQGGDAVGFNACYTVGAPGFCTNNSFYQLYNSSTSVALGWVADGVFGTGTQVELTQAW